MRIFEPKVIITKLKQNPTGILFFCIIAFGAFLRLFAIDAHAEFLGDQGRTSMILYEWLHGGSVPLAGPTTLSGHHLGPVFYYLIAPFYILGAFGPLSGSLAMVFYGLCAIVLIYISVRQMHGQQAAFVASFLYAISPVVVTQDRTLWEPNLVVLFTAGFSFFVLQLYAKKSAWSFVGLGAMCAVLIQLHYPNLIFIGLVGFLLLSRAVSARRWKTFVHEVFFASVGFLAVLVPFIIYEARNNFGDISGIFSVIGGGSQGLGKRVMLHNFIDYAGRVFGTVLPGITPTASVVIMAGWCLVVLRQMTFLNIFWSVWFFLGLTLMARYNGVVYDHYLLFLLVPFLFILSLFVSFVSRIRGARLLGIGLLICIAVTQIVRSDIWRQGNYDMYRTGEVTKAILSHTQNTPFAFTLISSNSFSDLHYRYFFLSSQALPNHITKDSYNLLYLVCDRLQCPDESDIAQKNIEVMCFDHHCVVPYPRVDLKKDFVFVKKIRVPIKNVGESIVYVFSKKSVQ